MHAEMYPNPDPKFSMSRVGTNDTSERWPVSSARWTVVALAAEERSSPPGEDVNRSAEPNSGLEGEPGLVGALGKEKPCANREGLESGFSGALG